MTIERPDERGTAERAYALWEARGRPIGSPHQDWFEAETQLCSELDDVTQPKATLDPLAQEAADKLMDDVIRPTGEAEDRTAEPLPQTSPVLPEAASRSRRRRH
jgi:Protein of unknown function (DUF2934)